MNSVLYVVFKKRPQLDTVLAALSRVNDCVDIEENIYDAGEGVIGCELDDSAITGQESLSAISKYCRHLKQISLDRAAFCFEFQIQDGQHQYHTRLHLDCSSILSDLSSCYAGIQFIAFPYSIQSSRRKLGSFFLIYLSVRGKAREDKTWKDIAQQGLSREEGIDYIQYKDHHCILLYDHVMDSYNKFITRWLKGNPIKYKLEDYALLHLSYMMKNVYTEVTLSAQSLQLLHEANISINIDIHKSFYLHEEDESPSAQVARYLFTSKKRRSQIQ